MKVEEREGKMSYRLHLVSIASRCKSENGSVKYDDRIRLLH